MYTHIAGHGGFRLANVRGYYVDGTDEQLDNVRWGIAKAVGRLN